MTSLNGTTRRHSAQASLPGIADGMAPNDLARFVHKSRSRINKHFAGDRDPVIVRGLEPGERISLLTDYRISLIDYLEALIDDAAPCRLDFATWGAHIGDLGRLAIRAEAGDIVGGRVILDRGLRTCMPKVHAVAVDIFGVDAIRECRLHAKIAVLDAGPGRKWAVQSSMNLNGNTRVENFDATRDDGLADMYAAFFDMVFEKVKPGESDQKDPFRNVNDEAPATLALGLATPQDAIAARIAKNRRRAASARVAAHG